MVLSPPTSWDLYCHISLIFAGLYSGSSGPTCRKSHPTTLLLDLSGLLESWSSLHGPFLLVSLTCLQSQHPVDHSVKAHCQLEALCGSTTAIVPSVHFGNQMWKKKKNTSLSGWFWVESMVCDGPASISSLSSERACFQAESWSQSTSPRDQDRTWRFSFMVMIPLRIIVTFSPPTLSNFKLDNVLSLAKLLIFHFFLFPLPLS